MKNFFYAQGGTGMLTTARIEVALKNGHHVHAHSAYGDVKCEGGDPECPIFEMQLSEAMTVWNVRNT
ncbi:hypothetical protein ACFWPU_00700 [Streptomyces sp. NPDC058471]|uniref:hypothetical protein n=1 Tax=Streptomyces sp. NPDC058471 TaxID=3346516 RepID=UPI003650AE97